jgi:hypothetical protein
MDAVVDSGSDHDGAIHGLLFLKTRVGVVPVGPCLPQTKFKCTGVAWLDGRGREIGDAILHVGHQKPMPVERSLRVGESVVNPDSGPVPLLKVECRTRDRSVNCQSPDFSSSRLDDLFRDYKVVFGNPP